MRPVTERFLGTAVGQSLYPTREDRVYVALTYRWGVEGGPVGRNVNLCVVRLAAQGHSYLAVLPHAQGLVGDRALDLQRNDHASADQKEGKDRNA